MNILYVIGNGFDRHHKLMTSYSCFYQEYRELLDGLSDYFPNNKDEYPWHKFEDNLGKYDSDTLFSEYNNFDIYDEKFKPSMIYGLEDEISEQTETIVSNLQDAFSEWINSIEINPNEITERLNLAPNASYLSFNYTTTLEKIYNIQKESVVYIHGCAERYDDLIFGHGLDIDEEPEFDEDGESLRTPFSDAMASARYPLSALKKPVPEIINKNSSFFSSLSSLDHVFILGHSISCVDHPYFIKIKENVPDNFKWVVSYYSDDEIEKHKLNLSACGVDVANIISLSLSDLNTYVFNVEKVDFAPVLLITLPS
ncbi:bacteriophage abortive infection AbiH family protein [Aeromonas rivipollensis]|uniref:bacteriophage abortive infection AbiH family protein n=1 Tax=Aeromonas rivipollensis TaxID=948519 RepID=UPI003D206C5F